MIVRSARYAREVSHRPTPPVPDWACELLRCPVCQGEIAFDGPLRCSGCGRSAATLSSVLDFLADPHPAVAREAAAVAALDREEIELPRSPAAEDPLTAAHRHVESTLREIDVLLDAAPLIANTVLVELGADACQATPRFLAAGARVFAVDISHHLETPVDDPEARLVRLRADMNRLPLRDGAADVVWATAAAHHSWDLARTLREAARVLRSGGRLVLCCEPMPGWLRWLGGWGVGAEERALGINETWIPRSRWRRWTRRAGFDDIRIEIPSLSVDDVAHRLARRGLSPRWVPLVRPFLRPFQVSVHLLAFRG